MIISDLNVLEVVEATEVLGGNRAKTINLRFKKDLDVNVNVDKDVNVKLKLDGNFADVEGESKAYGNNTVTEILFYTKATPYSSTSAVSAFSAVDDGKKKYGK
jgi:hypothetical protein